MHEILAKVLNEVHSAWRFRWLGVAAAWMLCLAGWTWVASQPDIYEGSASVYVDTSSVLRPILRDQIIPTDVSTQLAYVRQSILGREHLERVAREHGLDGAATEPERVRQLNRLREDISINISPAAGAQGGSSIYSISYRHPNREVAAGVVRTLLDSLVEGTLGARREGTDTAERFLDARIQEYEARLQEAEAALASFKRRNANRLPGAEGDYFERLQGETQTLRETERALRLAESRRDQIRAQLAGESPILPGVDQDGAPNSLDARIREFRAQLDRLMLEYTERHPDVIAVRDTLDRLETQQREQLEALGERGVGQSASAADANPVYQALRISLNEAEAEIATLRADVRERSTALQQLQALIDDVPEVEKELARLNRDYNVVYETYQGLIRSRETQNLSRMASDTDQIEFRPINSPQASFDPVAPPRLKLIALILFAGFGLGAGVCYVLAQLRPVFSEVRTLREMVGVPVLGAVSRVSDAASRRRRHLEFAAIFVSIITLVGLAAVAALIEISGPGLNSVIGGA